MKQHDVIVIGAGPGGYVAALRAAQLGLDTACIDENPQLGGTCLRVGCIPSKALLESSYKFYEAQHALEQHGVVCGELRVDLPTMLQRKDRIVQTLTSGIQSLLKKNRVTHYRGRARLDGPGQVLVRGQDQELQLRAPHVIIATGSKPSPLAGVELDGERVGTSTEALAWPEVPQHLVVIGGGYIGLELGSVWNRLGARVTVLEALDRILPGTDAELADKARRLFEKQGLEFRLGSRVERAAASGGDRCRVECEGTGPIECDRVLLAVGRRPNTDDLGLETVGVETDRRGQIDVDHRFQAADGVYAIGDCIRGPMLAHKASDEGMACVESIAGGVGQVNYDAVPAVIFTHPEIASVGKTEEQLEEAGRQFRKGVFPFRASGRARTLGDLEGLVKLLADRRSGRILGVHILGPSAGELVAEAVAALAFGATCEDLALTMHAHPTLAEAVREAALAAEGRALHA